MNPNDMPDKWVLLLLAAMLVTWYLLRRGVIL